MRTLGFVQARMGSTRLPGKVLEQVADLPLLAHVLERVSRTPGIAGVALLTSDAPQDDPLRRLAAELDVAVVSGSSDDVLDRFHLAARQLEAEAILRVTGDCPLVDSEVLGELVNTCSRTPSLHYAAVATGAMAPRPGLCRYPDGLDGEFLTASTLALAWRESRDGYEREHVTPFVWRRPERFSLALVQAPEDLGGERWTVDYPSDLAFVRAVYDRLSDRKSFGYRDVLELLAREPELRELNAGERAYAATVR